MEGRKAAINGASAKQNESETKVNKTQLLQQRIEENRLRMQQRGKDLSVSKKNIEQLMNQLDSSTTPTSILNMSLQSVDLEDTKDSKIASLETTISSLKSEKRDMEMRLISFETIQEAKECLEVELGELKCSYDNLQVENSMLQTKLETLYQIEDENDELKATLDRLNYENTGLKRDVESKDQQMINQGEEFQRQINDLVNERKNLQGECQDLLSKLNTQQEETAKAKKSRSKRPKAQTEDVALLSAEIESLKQQLASGQQKIKELMNESSAENSLSSRLSKELANLQTQLQEKEEECLALVAQLDQTQMDQGEVFKLKAKLRDAEYLLESKEESLREVQAQLDSKAMEIESLKSSASTPTVAPESGVKVSSLGSSPKKSSRSKRGSKASQQDDSSLSGRLALVEEQLASAQSEKRTLQQRIELLLTELDSERTESNDAANVQTLLAAKESECTQLMAEKEELRQQLDGTERELFDLRAQNRDAQYKLQSRDEMVNQMEQDKASNSAAIGRLQDSLREVRQQLEEAEKELDERGEAIKRLDKSCASLGKEAAEKAAEVERLREDLSEAETVLGEQDTKLKAVQDELKRIKQRNDAEDDGRSTLEAQMDHAQMEKEMLRQDLVARCTQLDECRETGNRLEAQLETSRVRESELTSQLEVVIAERAAAEEKFSVLTEKYKKLAGNYKQKLQTVKQLEAKLGGVAVEPTGTPVEPSDMSTRSAHGEEQRQELQKQLESALQAASEANTQLQSAQSQLQALTEENQLNCDRMADENRNMLAQLQSVQDVRQALDEAEERIQLLNGLNGTTTEQLEEAKLALSRMENDVQSSRAEIQRLTQENCALIGQLDELGEAIPQLNDARMALSRAETEVQRLYEENVTLSNRSEGLGVANSQLDEVQRALHLAEAEVQRFIQRNSEFEEAKTSLDQAQTELQSSRAAIQHLSEENEALVDRLEELASITSQLEETKIALSRSEAEILRLTELTISFDEVKNTLNQAENLLQSSQAEIQRLYEENGALIQRSEQLESTIFQLDETRGALVSSETEIRRLNELINGFDEVKMSLNQAENELQSSRAEIQRLCQENGALIQRSEGLEQITSQLNETKAALSQAEVEIQRLTELGGGFEETKTAFNRAESEIQRLNEENSQLTDQIEQLSFKMDQMEAHLHLEKSSSEEKGRMVAQLQEDFAAGARRRDEMQDEMAGLWQEKTDLAAQLAQISTIQQEQKSAETDQMALLWQENTDLTGKNRHLQDELVKGLEDLMQVQNQWKADKEQLDLLSVRCLELAEEKEKLDGQLADLNNQYAGLYSSYGSIQFDKSSLENQLADARLQLEELKQQQLEELEAARLSVEGAAADRDNLTYLLDRKEAETKELEVKLAELRSQLSGAEQSAADVREIGLLRVRLADLEEEKDELSYQLDAKLAEESEVRSILEKALERSSSNVTALEAKVTELEARNTASQAAQDQAKEVYEALSVRLASLESENQQLVPLRLTLDEAGRERDDLTAKLDRNSEELSMLRLKLFEALSEKEELASSHQALEEEMSSLRANFQEKIQLLSSQRDDLSQQLSSCLTQVDELRQQLENNNKFGAEEADKAQRNTEELADLKKKLFEAVSEKADVVSMVERLEGEVSSLRTQLSSLQETQRLLAGQRDDLSDQISVQMSERDQLLDRIADLTQQVETWKQKWDSEEAEKMQHSGEEVSMLRLQLFEAVSEKEEMASSIQSQEEELATLRSGSVELNSRLADLAMERQLLMDKCMELNDIRAALETAQMQLASQQQQQTPIPSPELAELRTALLEKQEELDELSIAQSEKEMELEETVARLKLMEQQFQSEREDWQRRLDDAGLKLAQQIEHIDRVSVERDHLQQSVQQQHHQPPPPPANQEVSALLDKITALETELHETRIKAAKSLRQVKLLKAEAAKQKEASPGPKGGTQDSFFAAAAEEELRKQAADAAKATAEKVKEIERLLQKIDTLEGASERFMMAKERADTEMALLQQRNRELLAQISSLEWDKAPEPTVSSPPPPSAAAAAVTDQSEQLAQLESTVSQLTDDNEHYQDLLDELKAEREAMEAELKSQLAEKVRLLEAVNSDAENKDRLLLDAYESVDQLRRQIQQMTASSETESNSMPFDGAVLEELRRENDQLLDMVRQLSTTGTLDAATVQRLREEMESTGSGSTNFAREDPFNPPVDWRDALNDLQIEVEYLRSQNAALLDRLQEAGLVWDEATNDQEIESELSDRTERLRAQLDAAIRNVHERDMRCQELTWEITKLLEERDTLQLRLSNALRHNHQMQQELKDVSDEGTANSNSDVAAKLRELKQLNYSLDVQLRREQEERQTIERQLMALYGTRPGRTSPYKASTAVESTNQQEDLDTSQDSNGTGQVLSEWLRGKGPSVQHI